MSAWGGEGEGQGGGEEEGKEVWQEKQGACEWCCAVWCAADHEYLNVGLILSGVDQSLLHE